MIRSLNILLRHELINVFGINKLRHSTDKSARKKAILMFVAYGILLLTVVAYVSMIVSALVAFGASQMVASYLFAIVALLIILLNFFSAGSVMFAKSGLDSMLALPITSTQIVIARFARMYLENFLLALIVLLTGFCTYFCLCGATFAVVCRIVLASIIVPVIPIAISLFFGVFISFITARLKNKSLFTALISILIVVAVMMISFSAGSGSSEDVQEVLSKYADVIYTAISNVYVIAIWLGMGVFGVELPMYYFAIALSLAVSVVVLFITAKSFTYVCRKLQETSAKHNYKMVGQNKTAKQFSLVKREFKRFFASSIYVTNTIISPLMCIIFGVALFFVDNALAERFGLMGIDMNHVMPIFFAAMLCLSTPAVVSVSMEGATWWQLKSLPVTTKEVVNAKILLSVLLFAPLALIAEICAIIALDATLLQSVWIILVPFFMLVASVTFAVYLNLKIYNLDWKTEVTPVKQSINVVLGMIFELPLLIINGAIVFILPELSNLAMIVTIVLCCALSAIFYSLSAKTNLADIN